MNKAQLEEAVDLVIKHRLFRFDKNFNERLAELIAEVRATQPPQDERGQGQSMDTMQAIYAKAWSRAADWANRHDLHSDIGSPEYLKDMAIELAEFADAAEPEQPVALSTLADVRAILYQCDRGNVSLSWLIDALRGIVERAASVQVQPVGEEGDRLIALAEKCSAEVGRYEGDVMWVKFHSRSSVEAFAAGIVMSSAVRAHAATSAPAQQAGQGWKLVPIEPTEEMKAAPRRDRAGFSGNVAREIYQSMLAASPTQEPSTPPQPVAAEVEKDAQRYRFLRMDAGIRNERPFIAISSAGGISQWIGFHADKKIDSAMAGTGSDESAKENGNGL